MTELTIKYIPLSDLKPYEKNARKHEEKDISAIMASIREFGFDDPVGIWSDENIIVEGHGRVMAAQRLGMTEIPCIRLDHLTDEQRRAYALAHNRTAELSEWDFVIRDDELRDITEIDMSAFGFDVEDMDASDSSTYEDDYEGEVPEEPKAKIGDLYQLGNHRLICGDSTDPAVIDRLMDGVKADIAITSPPYGESKSAGIRNHYEKGKTRIDTLYKSHDDNIAHWYDLVQGSLLTMRSATKAQFINIQMLADNKRDLLRFLNENKDWFVDVIVWDKKKAPPQMESNILNNAFEFIFCFCDEGASRKIPFGDFHGNVTNIIELPCGHNEYADIHKAVYPVELPARIMEIAKSAKSILDPFGGTGTTLIACEQLNRKCYMCELDPHYIDVIIDRWETLTGKKAVLLSEKN